MRQNLHSLSKQSVLGCLYGAALGDALGAATEFLSVPKILARFPPHGPQEPPGNPARVTDDTLRTGEPQQTSQGSVRPLAP